MRRFWGHDAGRGCSRAIGPATGFRQIQTTAARNRQTAAVVATYGGQPARGGRFRETAALCGPHLNLATPHAAADADADADADAGQATAERGPRTRPGA